MTEREDDLYYLYAVINHEISQAMELYIPGNLNRTMIMFKHINTIVPIIEEAKQLNLDQGFIDQMEVSRSKYIQRLEF
jgi:hypothetical protein